MDNSEIDKLFTKIYNEYSEKLLNWVNQKVAKIEDAEDIVQEIFVQILKAIKKEDIRPETLNNYVWKIAYFTWCKNLRDKVYKPHPIPEEIDLNSKEDDYIQETIKKIRYNLSRLNYQHREAMIMHYIEKMPTKKIAAKMGLTDGKVRKLLFESRNKLRKDISKMEDKIDYTYRPYQLQLFASGDIIDYTDISIMRSCLCRQNICIACYTKPCNIEELSEILGLPNAYIESYLKWLVDKEFLKKEKNRYSTMFFIVDCDYRGKLLEVLLDHKSSFFDKMVDKYIAKHDKIKKIGFYGSDQPLDKLLWPRVCDFVLLTALQYSYSGDERNMDWPIRTDGGRYHIIGNISSEPSNLLKLVHLGKHQEIQSWKNNASYKYNDNKNQISWYSINNGYDEYLHKITSNAADANGVALRNMLFKTLEKDFDINKLTEEEKLTLSKIISYGWVSYVGDRRQETGGRKQEAGDSQIVPNFYVFTQAQRNELDNIFLEVYDEMKDDINNLLSDISNILKDIMPKQLGFFKDYALWYSLFISFVYSAGFAYFDGKLYVPKTEEERRLMTLEVTI